MLIQIYLSIDFIPLTSIGEVTRPNYVKVKAQDRFGKDIEVEGEGFLARAFCHEIDHLEGILFVERVEDTEKGE